MSDFTTPVQFIWDSQATVEKLNSFVNNATLNPSFINDKSLLSNTDLDTFKDLILIYDSGANNLKSANADDLSKACLTNKFRGKIYAPSTSVQAGINIGGETIVEYVTPEVGDLIITNENLYYVGNDNKLIVVIGTGENIWKNSFVVNNKSVNSLKLLSGSNSENAAFILNNVPDDKSHSFIISWSGKTGINASPSTSANLSIGDGIKFSDGSIQKTSGNEGTGLPNTLVENGTTVNGTTYWNWTDPNETNPNAETQKFRIKLDWGVEFKLYEQAIVTYPFGTDINIMNEFPPFSNGGSHTWKIKSNTSVKIATTVQESFIWQGYPGCENDGLGACETNPITTYKGYEIWEFDAYRSTVNTLQGPDVHTATNTYNIPEKSWMFRDNSTGFIQQWLYIGSNETYADPPQNVGTIQDPVFNKIYRYKLPIEFPNKCFGVTVVPERQGISTKGQFSTPDASHWQVLYIPANNLPNATPEYIMILTWVKVPEVVKPALYGQWSANIDVDNDAKLNTVVLANSQLDIRTNQPHSCYKGALLVHAYGY